MTPIQQQPMMMHRPLVFVSAAAANGCPFTVRHETPADKIARSRRPSSSSARICSISNKTTSNNGGKLSFSTLGDSLAKKEKVEEDRYIRQLDQHFIQRRRQELANLKQTEELKEFETIIAPVMIEAAQILDNVGTTSTTTKSNNDGALTKMMDPAALEALARWKLDMHENKK